MQLLREETVDPLLRIRRGLRVEALFVVRIHERVARPLVNLEVR
jgi:hypothetical protein